MDPVTIVKLGGSAITKKSIEATPDLSTIHVAVDQLSTYRSPLIVLHGAGSYGHQTVKRARLDEGLRNRSQLMAVGETELLLDQLTRIIEVSFARLGVPFVPLRSMSFLTMRGGRVDGLFTAPLIQALKHGFTPIIHGDLAFDSRFGISVISADQLASKLGAEFKDSRVLFGCAEDGVFSGDPVKNENVSVIPRIDKSNYTKVLRLLRPSRSADATGGMYGKVTEAISLAKKGRTALIFNLRKKGLLTQALKGDINSGTLFPSWNS